eukprot:3215271-Alexandrium_andersonii.AAC.1
MPRPGEQWLRGSARERTDGHGHARACARQPAARAPRRHEGLSHAGRVHVRACARVSWIPGGLRKRSDHPENASCPPAGPFRSQTFVLPATAAEGLVSLGQDVCCLGRSRVGNFVCFGPRHLGAMLATVLFCFRPWRTSLGP